MSVAAIAGALPLAAIRTTFDVVAGPDKLAPVIDDWRVCVFDLCVFKYGLEGGDWLLFATFATYTHGGTAGSDRQVTSRRWLRIVGVGDMTERVLVEIVHRPHVPLIELLIGRLWKVAPGRTAKSKRKGAWAWEKQRRAMFLVLVLLLLGLLRCRLEERALVMQLHSSVSAGHFKAITWTLRSREPSSAALRSQSKLVGVDS